MDDLTNTFCNLNLIENIKINDTHVITDKIVLQQFQEQSLSILSEFEMIINYEHQNVLSQSQQQMKFHHIISKLQQLIIGSKQLLLQLKQYSCHKLIDTENNNQSQYLYHLHRQFYLQHKTRNMTSNPFFLPESESNLLKERFPYIFQTIDPIQDEPINIDFLTCGMAKHIYFKCMRNNNHRQKTCLNKKVKDPYLCPQCPRLMPNSISFMDNPNISQEYAFDLNIDENNFIINPYQIKISSRDKFFWRCTVHKKCNSHIWSTSPSSRKLGTGHETGCPFCLNQQTCECNSIYKDERLKNSFCYERNRNNDGSMVDIKTIAPHSNKYFWWKCVNHRPTNSYCQGHFWYCKVNDRVNDNTNCPFCVGGGNHQVCRCNSFMNNSLLDKEFNTILNIDHQNQLIDPWTISSQSNKKLWWICSVCNYEWKTSVDHRNNKKEPRGCPNCSFKCLESIGSKLCRSFLDKKDIKYDIEYKIPLFFPKRRYDFMFEYNNHNFLLEYDGGQHFKMKPGWCDDEEDFRILQEIDKIKNCIGLISGFHVIRIHSINEQFVNKFLERVLNLACSSENKIQFLFFDDNILYNHMTTFPDLNVLIELRPNNFDELVYKINNLQCQILF